MAVSVWELLSEALNDAPKERPDNSVTPEEYATARNCSEVHARRLLAKDRRLKPVPYMTEGRKRAICYVPQ